MELGGSLCSSLGAVEIVGGHEGSARVMEMSPQEDSDSAEELRGREVPGGPETPSHTVQLLGQQQCCLRKPNGTLDTNEFWCKIPNASGLLKVIQIVVHKPLEVCKYTFRDVPVPRCH